MLRTLIRPRPYRPPDVTGPAPVVPASWPGTVQNPGDVHTASVPYDPVTGNFRAPNGGDLYSITDAPHPRTTEEDSTWQALMLR